MKGDNNPYFDEIKDEWRETFEEQIKRIKQKIKPIKTRPKPPVGEVWLTYYKNRIRMKGKDINYHQIARLILSGKKIKATCKLTLQDVTERVVLATMNTYLANHKGNLDKYLEILRGSV